MNPDKYILPALALTNLAAGFSFAVLIAKELDKITDKPNKTIRYSALLVGVYFLECVAFAAGMCTQILTIGLSFLWGIIFGLWLRERASARKVLKQAFFIALYGSLPTASFCVLIPLIWLVGGGHTLSAKEGISFGVPDFLPWPLNTILGFFTSLLIGTVVFKTVITTQIVNWLIHRGEKAAVNIPSKGL